MSTSNKKNRDLKIFAYFMLILALLVLGAFMIKESQKSKAPKPIHTPLPESSSEG